ncbi:MAG: ABC transporter ATP-binding protein [Anaerolineales bacterium]|nr:ABC transporter ATP-binding protein [Anaerolineales bacterium]
MQKNQKIQTFKKIDAPDLPLIEIRNLTKYYKTAAGETLALNGVNLSILRGEFVAVIGKSGAGKSTLVNLISGINQPTSGEVLFQGDPIHSLDEDRKARWRGKNLGIVFQFFQLLPSLNLIENITIPMDLCRSFPFRQQKARALQLLEQVGIAEHAYKLPSKISGGQQQRVAIARALANDPELIVADEPTGNLDSRTAAEIFTLFAELVDHGKTILVVSHDKEIAKYATRIVELSDGEIIADYPAPSPVDSASSKNASSTSPKPLSPSNHALGYSGGAV